MITVLNRYPSPDEELQNVVVQLPENPQFEETQQWVRLSPHLDDDADQNQIALSTFVRLTRELEQISGDALLPDVHLVRCFRREAMDEIRRQHPLRPTPLCAIMSLLCDLVSQGWQLRIEAECVEVRHPDSQADPVAERDRVRRSLRLARDEQLNQPPTRAFIKSMETRHLGPQGWVSIYSLMRDGSELGRALRRVRDGEVPLEEVVQPYLQFVSEGVRCEHTGLRLTDIWRYFRHTWLTPMRSTPGRSMMILVRDGAAPHHPIIGIAALSSSIVQQSNRDTWIGWNRESMWAELQENPTDETARWLLRSLERLIDSVQRSDFVAEGILTEEDIANPSPELLKRLAQKGLSERERHTVNGRGNNYRQQQATDQWATLANTSLYRSKRALALGDYLGVRRAFLDAGLRVGTAQELRAAAEKTNNADFKHAVARLGRAVKAERVGIAMMDISIAGAIAPYNALLGGKLVSLLVTSPEVRQAYATRYADAQSVIASAMKGEAVVRRPELVLLCTTGLFAGGSSQYNRVRMPASVVGGHGEMRFTQLKQTTTYGTFHISQTTLDEMMSYADQEHEGLIRVRGIFGEGVNPKLRKIRGVMSKLRIPQDELLRTGSPRALYVIPLAHNFRDLLLGRADRADPILPDEKPQEATRHMVAFWRQRWLKPRISQDEVLNAIEKNTLTYPIRHGAAVVLPTSETESQIVFEEISMDPQEDLAKVQ